MNETNPQSNAEPPRWDESRTTRLIAMIVSGAVVLADIYLLVVFLRSVDDLPGGWRAYWYVAVGILGILFFASARFRRHWKAFHAPPVAPGEGDEE